MTQTDDAGYGRQVLAHEGVDTTRMGEAQGRAAHPDLDGFAPVDAYVAGFQQGVFAFVKLLQAHPVQPNGLDILTMVDRLAHPERAVMSH